MSHTAVHSMSHTVHNGKAYARAFSTMETNDDDRWDACNTVHCGMAFASFATTPFQASAQGRCVRGRVRPAAFSAKTPSRSLTDVLHEDALRSVLTALAVEYDVATLNALRATCTCVSGLACDALAGIPPAKRMIRLLEATEPNEATAVVEKHLAIALVRNTLAADLRPSVIQLANRAAVGPKQWTLVMTLANAEKVEDDPLSSFTLHGFDDSTPPQCAETSSGSRPHLPRVIGGPTRLISLAGSSKQRRELTRRPLELCRVVRGGVRFVPTSPGDALIEELLRLAALRV